MSAFTPTLRLELSTANVAEIKASGDSVARIERDLAGMLEKQEFSQGNVQFTANVIRVLSTNQILTGYKAQLAAIFKLNDVTHVQTVTGDVIAIKFHIV